MFVFLTAVSGLLTGSVLVMSDAALPVFTVFASAKFVSVFTAVLFSILALSFSNSGEVILRAYLALSL